MTAEKTQKNVTGTEEKKQAGSKKDTVKRQKKNEKERGRHR